MRGTVVPVNKALQRPLLVGGVEKRWLMVNALIAFPLVAATHFQFPACLVGLVFFMVLHAIFMLVSKADPHLAKLIHRSSRYSIRPYFPAKSHPLMTEIWPIKTVSRPRVW